jgi:CHAT domain-containing protein
MKPFVLFIAIAAFAGTLVGDQSPVTVAEEIYVRFANGDVDGFKRLWADGVTPARLSEVGIAYRCLTPVAFQEEQAKIDGEHGEVRLVAVMSRASRPTGRVTFELEHATVGLRRAGDDWRVERWTIAENDLAERIIATKSDAEARSLLREGSELLDTAAFRALRRRSTDLINRRNFAALARLTAALHEMGGLNGDDSMLSTAYVFDSIVDRIGDHVDAAAALRDIDLAVVLAEQSGDADALASALVNRGRALQWRDGNSNSAAAQFERVIALRGQLEDESLVSRSAIQIAVSHAERGEYRACFPYIRIAQEIATRLNNITAFYEVETLLTDIYASENDLELAVMHALRSRELADQMHYEVGWAAMTEYLARCYQQLGRRGEFHSAADALIARAAKSGGLDAAGLAPIATNVYTDLAFDDLQQGDVARADADIENALRHSTTINDDVAAGRAREMQARIRLAQQRYGEAIEAAERTIDLRVKEKSVTRATPWLLAAQAHLALGERAAAYAALYSAVEYGEQERSGVVGSERQMELSFEPTAAAYVMLVEMLIEDHRGSEAFLIAEKARARTLLDVLASERSSIEQDISPAERAEEQRLEQHLVEMNRKAAASPAELEKARLDLESFRAALEGRYPRLHATRGAGHLDSLSSLSPVVTGRRALVEYLVGEKQLHLFIVVDGRHGPQLVVRSVDIGRAALGAMVGRFATQLASRDAAYRATAERLYRIVLQPALQVAGEATVLAIVPDDVLWRVPFEAFVDGGGRFAVESRAFHYAPSAAMLLAEHARRKTEHDRTFVGFGNPRLAQSPKSQPAPQLEIAERSETWTPIPEAEREVRSIARLFRPAGSAVYTGAAALESRSKKEAPHYAVVHFATHGVMDNANPMYSRLLLARNDGDGEDGVLEAREMMTLHLTADMVVLSACDTARGDVHAGEGLIGMTWALFAAGSPSVVASEWRVASATTETFMETFYRRWLRSHAAGHSFAKAEALRAARLGLLRDGRYRHPYYWAAFVLIGDPD